MYVSKCTFMCTCGCIGMDLAVLVCVRVRAYVCVCVCIHVYESDCTNPISMCSLTLSCKY